MSGDALAPSKAVYTGATARLGSDTMKTINVRELRTAFLAAHRAQMATLPVALDVLIREQRDKR